MALTKKQREEATQKGIDAVDLTPVDDSPFRRPTPSLVDAGRAVFAKREKKTKTAGLPAAGNKKYLGAGPQSLDLGADPQEGLGAGPQFLEPPVSPSLGPTPEDSQDILGPRGRPLEVKSPIPTMPLAPLQWAVWQYLLTTEEGQILNYSDIAHLVGGKRQGVKKAIKRLQTLGAVISVDFIQEKQAQGVRITMDRDRSFYKISLDESKGLPKISQSLDLGAGPQSLDPTRMYVFNNKTYIQETLLRLLPVQWVIREQTLRKIWEQFPEMSRLEFSRSLRYLIKQAKSGPPIQNHNAWLLKAFQNNQGPLVTEAMMDTQLDQLDQKPVPKTASNLPLAGPDAQDLETMRCYMAASAAERAEIDQRAEERTGPLLKTLSLDKHAGILEQARLEMAREYFAGKG